MHSKTKPSQTKPARIDYRSDTVTLPTPAMLDAMLSAELGDDVYGEDPSISALEQRLADMADKEAGLFFPSGTQSNLTALLAHCQRGEEVIVGQDNHVFGYEARGASVLGGVSLHSIPNGQYGAIDTHAIEAAIKEDDAHYPVTRLISLENTVSGCVQPPAQIEHARQIADEHGLSVHLDGARIFNAAVASKCELSALTKHADSVSICLSKGLGTPAGSVLVASNEVIRTAHRLRKMLGGGMRQAGILAAAGLYALDHNVERLQDDHIRAKTLATELSQYDELKIDLERVQSNMLFITPQAERLEQLQAFMAERDIVLGGQRMVLHLGIDDDDMQRTLTAFAAFFAA